MNKFLVIALIAAIINILFTMIMWMRTEIPCHWNHEEIEKRRKMAAIYTLLYPISMFVGPPAMTLYGIYWLITFPIHLVRHCYNIIKKRVCWCRICD